MQLIETRSADGSRLRLARFNEGSNRQLLIVHGLAEHIGRYEWLSNRLSKLGYGVTVLELRGHGESDGKRGHVGLWINYQEDVMAALSVIGQPTIIVAHSMGGLVSLCTLLENLHPPVIGIALSNPLLGLVKRPSRLRQGVGRILARAIPTLKQPNEVKSDFLCRDKEIVDAYEYDPLVFDHITVRWGREMLKALVRIHDSAHLIKQPMLMMLGDQDYICDAEQSRHFTAAYGGESTLKQYPKLYHELFNEPEKELVCNDLTAWLDHQFTTIESFKNVE